MSSNGDVVGHAPRALTRRAALGFIAPLLICPASIALAQTGPGEQSEAAEKFTLLLKQLEQTQDIEQRILLIREALKRAADLDPWPFPSDRKRVAAHLYFALARAFELRTEGEFADNIEETIAAYKSVLSLLDRATYPVDWARTQTNLGSAYSDRIHGDPEENQEVAIASFNDALSVFTKNAFPEDWAFVQNDLGGAYRLRVRGSRAENIESAIACFNGCLEIYTFAGRPLNWAMAQQNLGVCYQERLRGDRAENIELGLAACEDALRVFNPEQHADEWGTVHNTLGVLYRSRIEGERAQNLELAIECYDLALTVKPGGFGRAEVKSNLGDAYRARINGSRSDNIEFSISCIGEALAFFRRTAYPERWADTTENLGASFFNRIKGDKTDNVKAAIAAYEDALAVHTQKASPQNWAEVNFRLGVAYAALGTSTPANNLEKAINAFENSLIVFTATEFPRAHLRSANRLGQTLLEKADWSRAAAQFASGRDVFRLLLEQGFDDEETQDLIAEAGSLFANAAYASAEEGQLDVALSLLDEGKARQIGVSLRQAAVDLPQAAWDEVVKIRRQIRECSRIAEKTKGAERAQATRRVRKLRDSLAQILRPARETAITPSDVGGLVSGGAVIVAPLATSIGGKLLIVVAGKGGNAEIIQVPLPQLTSGRLDSVFRGDSASGQRGWLGDYNVNDLLTHLAQQIDIDQFWLEFGGVDKQKLKQTLEAKTREFDDATQRWHAAIETMGVTLWDLFAGALERQLAAMGVGQGARLTWLPVGPLGLVPLGLACDPASGARLGERYQIVNAPNLSVLIMDRNTEKRDNPLSAAVVANPTGDLTFAEMEAVVVSSHFSPAARVVLDRTRSRDDVLSSLQGRSYWHFATHGQFSWTDGRKSALFLSDGRPDENGRVQPVPLSVGELIAASEVERFGRPRLVTLSACETGLYDISHNPDEFMGFAGAFMAIGAKGVLSTLWLVDDRATMLLMARFYEQHLSGGMAPAAALKAAQDWLRTSSGDDLLEFARAKLDADRFQAFEDVWNDAAHVRSGIVIGMKGSPGASVLRGHGALPISGHPFAHPYYWAAFVYNGS